MERLFVKSQRVKENTGFRIIKRVSQKCEHPREGRGIEMVWYILQDFYKCF